MNGGQDLGGMMGFGPVEREEDEPPFHSEWERRIFAVTLAASKPGKWNLDMTRFARESIAPQDYLNSSYYEIWLAGLEKQLLERGMVSREELASGQVLVAPAAEPSVLQKADAARMSQFGGPTEREATTKPVFDVGTNVRVCNRHPATHTRMPRYVRGRPGVVTANRGCHVFPDSNALGDGECPTWLYNVEFAAGELWGDTGNANQSVLVDLWEPYLERA